MSGDWVKPGVRLQRDDGSKIRVDDVAKKDGVTWVYYVAWRPHCVYGRPLRRPLDEFRELCRTEGMRT